MLKMISILLFTLLSCEADVPTDSVKGDPDQLETNAKQEQTNLDKEVITAEKLMRYSKAEAIELFGEPSSEERFIMDDAQGEFRNAITDVYSEEERRSESIKIDELTWEKDVNTWITVWYQVDSEETLPKATFTWDKGLEF